MKVEIDCPRTGVVVTGGASGIGSACAEALASVGRPVSLWDINGERSRAVAKEIAERYNVATVGIGVDVSTEAAIRKAAEQTRELLPNIGGLVHAAGIALPVPLAELDEASWDTVLNVNLRAFPLLVKAFLPDLRKQAGSAVVGIGSINATLGNAMNPAYTASKGGLRSLVRSLADDLARDGIRINTVSPGMILTPMFRPAWEGFEEGHFERRIMLGRLGAPEEIGRVVRFLLSNEASYVTAAEWVVDGGNIPSQR